MALRPALVCRVREPTAQSPTMKPLHRFFDLASLRRVRFGQNGLCFGSVDSACLSLLLLLALPLLPAFSLHSSFLAKFLFPLMLLKSLVASRHECTSPKKFGKDGRLASKKNRG